ncbi:TetR/AcrR family transcriptional regulator C-terminal domain-containing protein [Mycobacterium sp. pUA109]|uniref:TetR/AcrR family transcriptional regulator C-terminal domain-containing protein n=1 Tax=Mycobacterium sp. pUA109 TaxID=3238982 RepID=UPI00351B6781
MSRAAADLPDVGTGAAGPRRRGRPRQLSRELIASAARDIAPEALTMQAVADALGVDPKALNYHVGDRDGLLELVALDVFETELARIELAGGGDWRDALRCYARAQRDATIKLGVLALSVRFPGSRGLGALSRVETVLQALIDAGFGPDEAGRVLTFVTETAFSSGLAAVQGAQNRVHPDVPEVINALESADAQDFPALRRVVAAREQAGDDPDQLDYNLTVIIAGLEDQLAARPRRP